MAKKSPFLSNEKRLERKNMERGLGLPIKEETIWKNKFSIVHKKEIKYK